MTSKTSEAELTALERSKDQPVHLIDQAARIAGVRFDKHTKSYKSQKASQFDATNDFRQQWLLKWLLKRFNEASSSSGKNGKRTSDTSVVQYQQAWSFLAYLFQHISNQNLLDILLERNFTRVFCECASIILKQYTLGSDHVNATAASSHTSQDTDERPQKRRRLSNDNEDHSPARAIQSSESGPELDLLASLLEVISEFAEALQHASNVSEAASRKAIPSWATSTKEAATLIGRVVELANALLQRPHDIQKSKLALQAVTSCLNLWQDYSSADSALDKQLVHTQFNEACLNACLELLQSMHDQQYSNTSRAARTIIERQIAIHTLLPARSMFVDLCSSSWKSEQNVISWMNIEKPYAQFTSHLGAALQSEMIAGQKFLSLTKISHASLLIEIASRLVPKDDVRRRQWERPWFEALTLVLYHLAFPKDAYRLENTEGFDFKLSGTVLPPVPGDPVHWPTQYLDTIRDQQLSLSTPTTSYLAATTLLWRGHTPPVSILSRLIELDVDCFIPQPNVQAYQTCLDRLMTILEELDDLESVDLAQITHKVVIPLMKGYARSRDLKGFLEIWSPRLEDALRARATSNSGSSAVNPSLAWDSEELFDTFERICAIEAPSGLVKRLLTDVTSQIRRVAQKIGSTADIFAQVAILVSVLRARSLEIISPGGAAYELTDLAEAACNALAETNDYQGQRWRLWSLLRTLQTFGRVDFAERGLHTQLWTLITDTFSRVSLNSGELNTGESMNQLFEVFQCFVLLTETDLTSGDVHKQACDIAAKELGAILDQNMTTTTSNGSFDSAFWDGRIESLKTAQQLLCGCLTALLRKARFAQLAITEDTRSVLKRIAIRSSSNTSGTTSGHRTVGEISQVLLVTLDKITNKSAFQDFAEFLLESGEYVIPSIMHSLSMEEADKSRISNLAEREYQKVLEAFEAPKQDAIEEVSSSLALLSRLVIHYPVSVGLPDQFSGLCKLVQAADASRAYGSATSIRSALIKIIDIFQSRVLRMEKAEKMSMLMDQMRAYSKSESKFLRSAENRSSNIRTLLHNIVSHLLDGKRYEVFNTSLLQDSAQPEDVLSRQLEHPAQIATLNVVDNLIAVNVHAVSKKDDTSDSPKLDLLNGSDDERSNLASCLKTAALINSLSKENIQSSPQITQSLNAMAALEDIADESDPLRLVLKLETSILVLNVHPSIVNQASVDALLESLASIASSASKTTKPDTISEAESARIQPSAIYDRLITLLGILLTRHRRRLSGRTHLLLPLLQNLLKCLFYTPSKVYIHQNPSTTKQKQAFRSSLPPWLQLNSNKPLPPSSAEKYSRILSSICNPTTASARSAHRTNNNNNNDSSTKLRNLDLNDETSKAKRLAAQYMQYLIMEYARCTLDGIIAPETRDKLIPGLYVVLDALDRDLMRAMNAAMDPSSRAIFKGLYDEWVRFGRWDQS